MKKELQRKLQEEDRNNVIGDSAFTNFYKSQDARKQKESSLKGAVKEQSKEIKDTYQKSLMA